MLITVIVITYNSSKYVFDTLNSIFNQTFPNIELIISDDCSTDNTVNICEEWLTTHKQRFVHSIIVSTFKNGGISANYNNGLKYATGQWIKFIAGDDFLSQDCIEQFVNKAKTTSDREKLLICGTIPFNEKETFPSRIPPTYRFKGNARTIERVIVKNGTFIEGPTLFVETTSLRSLGGFDNRFPYIEDYPLYMKFLAHDYVIRLVDKPLVFYRKHSDSVSSSDDRFADSIYRAIDEYGRAAALRNHMYLSWWHLTVNKVIRKWSKEGVPSVFLYSLRATDIFSYKKFFFEHIKSSDLQKFLHNQKIK